MPVEGQARAQPAVAETAPLPPAIFLMGPTASGKSEVALQLAERLPVEIISVDSAQVYRHMDVGTAKPDAATRLRHPHHLIDVIEPTEAYSAAQFRDDALSLMGEIVQRGRTPLLVGGTMLYFRTLREGLAELPPADPATRQLIDAMAQDAGWPALHAELERIDAETAERISAHDAQRVQRALEVHYLTGKTMSQLIHAASPQSLPYRPIEIALLPSERADLHQRIAERFEAMLELGLLSEVRALREHFGVRADMPSMRCVGYRQVWQYLEGEYGLTTLREKAIAATRQLAKRQMTWLRSMDAVIEFDCLREDLPERVFETVAAQLAEHG